MPAQQPRETDSPPMPRPIQLGVGKRPRLTISPALSSTSITKKDLGVTEGLSNFKAPPSTSAQADHFTAFGEIIAAHLRKLDAIDAEQLESRIYQLVYDFLDTHRTSTSSQRRLSSMSYDDGNDEDEDDETQNSDSDPVSIAF